MNQKPKKHHFVPECYLRNFLDNRIFFTLDIRKVQKGYDERISYSNPSKVCYFENYYSINDKIFGDSDFDELFVESEVLKNLEDIYPTLYKKMIYGNQFLIEDCVLTSDFIVQLKLRNPYWFNNEQVKIKKNIVKDITLKDLELDTGFESIPIEFKKNILNAVLEGIKIDPAFDKRLQLNSLIRRYNSEVELNKRHRNAIVNCKWIILIAPEKGPYFITSDNPGVSVDNNKLVYNTKFDKNFTFYLPLSPQYCLCITDFEKDNVLEKNHPFKVIEKLQINRDLVFGINNTLIQLINKLLIAVDESYLDEIKNLNRPKS